MVCSATCFAGLILWRVSAVAGRRRVKTIKVDISGKADRVFLCLFITLWRAGFPALIFF